jgi:hypothetical protein
MSDVENPINAFENTSSLNEWSDDFEILLKNILFNSSLMSEHHKNEHLRYNRRLKWYKLPVIILSGINSVLSVSLNQYINQDIVSVINCFISLSISTIASIELYLQINKKSDEEAKSYKEFYNLSLKINNMLKLDKEHRTEEPKIFLNDVINQYETYFNESNVNGLGIKDKLIDLN